MFSFDYDVDKYDAFETFCTSRLACIRVTCHLQILLPIKVTAKLFSV